MADHETSHYDTVASTFLSVGATMIAIIASLLSVVRTQNALDTRLGIFFVISSILLIMVVLLSAFGLVTKGNTERKRTLCVIPAVPLVISIIVLMLTLL